MTYPPPPDPTNPDLLLNLRAYLMSQSMVRDPRDATTQATLPPMFLAPRMGTPAPGETEGLAPVEVCPLPPNGPGLVVSAAKATGIPAAAYEGFIRRDGVELVVRSKDAQPAYYFENQVRGAINDKRGWNMAGLPVIESLLFRDLQPVAQDNIAFTFTLEYLFTLWAPFASV